MPLIIYTSGACNGSKQPGSLQYLWLGHHVCPDITVPKKSVPCRQTPYSLYHLDSSPVLYFKVPVGGSKAQSAAHVSSPIANSAHH